MSTLAEKIAPQKLVGTIKATRGAVDALESLHAHYTQRYERLAENSPQLYAVIASTLQPQVDTLTRRAIEVFETFAQVEDTDLESLDDHARTLLRGDVIFALNSSTEIKRQWAELFSEAQRLTQVHRWLRPDALDLAETEHRRLAHALGRIDQVRPLQGVDRLEPDDMHEVERIQEQYRIALQTVHSQMQQWLNNLEHAGLAERFAAYDADGSLWLAKLETAQTAFAQAQERAITSVKHRARDEARAAYHSVIGSLDADDLFAADELLAQAFIITNDWHYTLMKRLADVRDITRQLSAMG